MPNNRALSLAELALAYAERRTPVVPASVRCDDDELPDHMAGGSTDPFTVRCWWAVFGPSKIGIPLGVVCDVLDVVVTLCVDEAHARERRRILEGYGEQLPWTVRAETVEGGFHLLYAWAPTGVAHLEAELAPGMHVRTAVGRMIAPGSPAPDDGAHNYRTIPGFGPTEFGLAAPPEWLVRLLHGRKPSPRRPRTVQPPITDNPF